MHHLNIQLLGREAAQQEGNDDRGIGEKALGAGGDGSCNLPPSAIPINGREQEQGCTCGTPALQDRQTDRWVGGRTDGRSCSHLPLSFPVLCLRGGLRHADQGMATFYLRGMLHMDSARYVLYFNANTRPV